MSTTQSSASSESGLIDDDSLSSVNYISAKIQESSSPRLSFNPSVCQLLSRISFGTRRSFEEGLFSSSNMSSSTLDAERQILYNNAVPDPETEFNPYWGYVGGGFFFFTVLHYFTKFAVPLSADVTRQQRWKWRNVFTSFCHSTITGIWAPLTFYADPAMCDDMIYAFNHSTHILISFSIGYEIRIMFMQQKNLFRT